MNGQSFERPSGLPLGVSIGAFALLAAIALKFFFAPIVVGVPILSQLAVVLAWTLTLGTAAAVFVWGLLNQTVPMLGIVLALMPLQFLFFILGNIYGLPHMGGISAAMGEVPFLLLACILLRRNGVKLGAADWFLIAFFTLGLIRTAFGGGIRGFIIDDFAFLIPYTAGRMTVLTESRKHLWARCAVWIAAVWAAVGVVEALVFGEAPRRALYALALPEMDDPLDFFHSTGFEGMRAASVMPTPTVFAALCMVALIIWWVYLRNPIPAGLIFAGLICAVTRSAWIGTAVAAFVLALRMRQKKRLATYALIGVVGFAVAVQFLNLREYLFLTSTGQDVSQQVHRSTLLSGLEYVGRHPLGTGAESVGPRIVEKDAAALHFESSYLILAAQYGLLAGLCFVGFLLAAMGQTWKDRTPLGYVASAVLIGFGLMMFFLPMHEDYPLDCWVWFPVGLAVRSSIDQGPQRVSQLAQTLRLERV